VTERPASLKLTLENFSPLVTEATITKKQKIEASIYPIPYTNPNHILPKSPRELHLPRRRRKW